MNTTTEKQKRKPRAKTKVNIIIERNFIGDKPMPDAFIPVIIEDLRSKTDRIRTFDNKADTS